MGLVWRSRYASGKHGNLALVPHNVIQRNHRYESPVTCVAATKPPHRIVKAFASPRRMTAKLSGGRDGERLHSHVGV
jgi:hypothetical protein